MHSRIAEAIRLNKEISKGHIDRKRLRDELSISTVMGPVNQTAVSGTTKESRESREIRRKLFNGTQPVNRSRLMRALGFPDVHPDNLVPLQRHLYDRMLRFSSELAAKCTIRQIGDVEMRLRQQCDEAEKRCDDEANKQSRKMKELKENILAMDEFWRSVNNTECGGRIAHAKTMSEYRETFDNRVAQLCTQGGQLDTAEDAMKNINDQYQNELKKCAGNALRVDPHLTKQVSDATRALQAMKSMARDLMGPNNEGSGGKKSDKVDLVVPKGLRIRSAGQELSKNFDHYIESQGEKYNVLHPYAERISRDITPTSGTFYRPPQKDSKKPYNEVPREIRKRYAEQNEVLYKIWKVKLDDSTLNECLRTFTYGTDNEMEAKIQEGDGLGIYWALMSMFRPLSDIWKEDVEKYITDAHYIFTSTSTNMLQEIGVLKEKIGEARLLGIRIKWFTTGKVWYQALSNRPRYNTALQDYHKPKKIDTDDCIVFLEAMVKDIQVIAREELSIPDTTSKLYVNGQMANLANTSDFDYPGEDEEMMFAAKGGKGGKPYQSRRYGDARQSQNLGRGRGPIDRIKRAAQIEYKHDERESPSGGRPYRDRAYAAADGKLGHAYTRKDCCFAKGCPGPKPEGVFQFCTGCHKMGLDKGIIMAKNQKQYVIKNMRQADRAERQKMFETLSQDANQWRNTEAASFAAEDDDKEFNEILREQMEFANFSMEEPDAKRLKHEEADAAVEEEEQRALAAAWKEQLTNLQAQA